MEILNCTAKVKPEFNSETMLKQFTKLCSSESIPIKGLRNTFDDEFTSDIYKIITLGLPEKRLYGIRIQKQSKDNDTSDTEDGKVPVVITDILYDGSKNTVNVAIKSNIKQRQHEVYIVGYSVKYLSQLCSSGLLDMDNGLSYGDLITADMENIHTIEDAMCSDADGFLSPVIYISKYADFDYMFDLDLLRHSLKGCAHIILGDNADVSNYLKTLLNKRNTNIPYAGYAGIYMNGVPVQYFNPMQNKGREQAASMLCGTVLKSTNHGFHGSMTWDEFTSEYQKIKQEEQQRREKEDELKKSDLYRNTIAELNQLKADLKEQQRLNENITRENNSLKKENKDIKKQAEDIIHKTKELITMRGGNTDKAGIKGETVPINIQRIKEEKDKQIAELQRELFESNNRYSHLKQSMEKQNTDMADRPLLVYGKETDKYEDEIRSVILEALNEYMEKNSTERTRRSDIISDILKANGYLGRQKKNRQEIRDVLNKTNAAEDIKKVLVPVLEKYGIRIEYGGKHKKIQFTDDERYIITASITASDYRTNKNLAADICRIML